MIYNAKNRSQDVVLSQCPDCLQHFAKLEKHLKSSCAKAVEVRRQIISIAKQYICCDCNRITTLDSLSLLWCGQHQRCKSCHATHTRLSTRICSSYFSCIVCGFKPTLSGRHEGIVANTNRCTNDCGIVSLNQILFTANAVLQQQHTYINPINHPLNQPNQMWELQVLRDLMKSKHFVSMSPFYSDQTFILPETLGVLIRPRAQHFYCLVPDVNDQGAWFIKDSIYGSHKLRNISHVVDIIDSCRFQSNQPSTENQFSVCLFAPERACDFLCGSTDITTILCPHYIVCDHCALNHVRQCHICDVTHRGINVFNEDSQ